MSSFQVKTNRDRPAGMVASFLWARRGTKVMSQLLALWRGKHKGKPWRQEENMKKTRTTFEQNLKQLNKTCNNMIRMFICSEAVTTDSQFLHVGFRVQRVQIRRISVFLAVLTYIKDQLIVNFFVWTLSLSLSLPYPWHIGSPMCRRTW